MSRTTAVYLGNNTALLKTIYGDKMYVDTRDEGIAPHLLMDGYWEKWIGDAMIPYLNQCLFFDIGANWGWYTLFAKRMGADMVQAFEPNPEVFKLLKRTVSVNGLGSNSEGVYLRQKGVSDGTTIAELQWLEINPGGGSCLSEEDAEYLSQAVEYVRLDTLGYQPFKSTPLVFKIDVEGMEPRVVLGGRKLITEYNCTLFVEYHADPKGKTKLVEMLDFFEQTGYSMSHVQHDSTIQPITREELAELADAEMLLFRRFSE